MSQPGIFTNFLYQHPLLVGVIAFIILLILLLWLGIRIWRRERVIGTKRLVVVAASYLILVAPFLVSHYNEAAQYYKLLKQIGLL